MLCNAQLQLCESALVVEANKAEKVQIQRATDYYNRYPRVKLDATADISGKETSGRGGKGELLLRARKSFNR